MIEITLTVPEDLAKRLQPVREQLPEILEIGLQYSTPLSIRAYSQALEFLATAPTPAEVLTFHPSPAIQTEVNRLLSIWLPILASIVNS